MASMLVHSTKVFNTFDNMGQSQVLSTKHDPNKRDDEEVSPVGKKPTNCDTLLQSYIEETKELPYDFSKSLTPDVLGDDSGIFSSNNNSSVDTDTNDELTSTYEELLCAGEIQDNVVQATYKKQDDIALNYDTGLESNNDINTTQEDNDLNNVDPVINGSSTTTMDWSEKKRQFSMMKQNQSVESISSDISSGSRRSVSSYLYARECDAEEILARLGFGCDTSIDIPDRFLANNNLVSSNSYIEKAAFVTSTCDDDVFASYANSTRTSIESSWSDSSFGRLPSRFTSSLSRSPLSSLSEPEDDDNNVVIPSIIEPVKDNHDDGFDLMRHLRLNRVHNDKGFLEPVLEEQEVSSVSSGSAQTKVAAQQDSFDSIGNISVVTKVSVSKHETEDLERKGQPVTTLTPIAKDLVNDIIDINSKCEEYDGVSPEIGQTPSQENLEDISKDGGNLYVNVPNADLGNSEFRERNLDSISCAVIRDISSKEKNEIATSELDNLEPKPDNVRLTSLKPYLLVQLPLESFELEEIATSEENLDKIEENVPRKFTRRETLKRDNSDDSSGFGDDAIDVICRKSTPNSTLTLKNSIPKENVSYSAEKLKNGCLDVPRRMSTLKDSAVARRSIFAKKQSWSTTKQKRVLFEDEVQLQKYRSLDNLPSKMKRFDIQSRSLDGSLPGSLSHPFGQTNEILQNNFFRSQSLDIPSERSSRVSLDHDVQFSCQSSRELKPNDIPLLQSKRLSSDVVEYQSHNSSKRRIVSKSYSLDIPRGRNFSNSKSSSGISLQNNSSSRKVICKSRSLDISSPTSNINSTNGVSLSLSQFGNDKQPRTDIHSQVVDLPQIQRTSSENKAISNIKEFMSNLWSLRSKLKKTSIISKTESLPTSSGIILQERPIETNEENSQHKSALDELSTFKEDLQEYYSSFMSMDIISTSQDSYFTRKLQARFAWDILFIRRLRSFIEEELDEIKSNLEYRTTLPSGVHDKIVDLLRLQSGLHEYLSSLANTAAKLSLEMQPAKTRISSLDIAPSTLNKIEDKIRSSIAQEVKSTFELHLGELRQEMKAKDSLIEELLKRIPKNETPP